MDIEQARFNMIEQQIRPWDVLDTDVLDLFHSVPREAFVDPAQAALAFADIELPIGHSQSMMSPKVEGRLLQALNIKTSDEILEIGTGSGFLSACLATMGKHVCTYEYFEDLSLLANQRLDQLGIKNIDYIKGDIFNHIDTLGSFDVIAVTGSLPQDSATFTRHLKQNGRMFCVTGERPVMTARLYTCVGDNSYRDQGLFETELAPLLSIQKDQEFSF